MRRRRRRAALGGHNANMSQRSPGNEASPENDELLVERCDGVVTATFNRPRARNALTYEMYEGLGRLVAEVDADPEARVLVLIGAGGAAFAAGTAIAQFESLRTEADSLAYEGKIETLLTALERCRVPTIAALAGAGGRGREWSGRRERRGFASWARTATLGARVQPPMT